MKDYNSTYFRRFQERRNPAFSVSPAPSQNLLLLFRAGQWAELRFQIWNPSQKYPDCSYSSNPGSLVQLQLLHQSRRQYQTELKHWNLRSFNNFRKLVWIEPDLSRINWKSLPLLNGNQTWYWFKTNPCKCGTDMETHYNLLKIGPIE